jgi:hypothetical protein
MPVAQTQSRTPNRMQIDTGHKTFDSQCDLITTGNAITNVQLSWYIRPVSATQCNGFTFPPGKLFESDIKPFLRDIPRSLLSWLRGLGQDVILYEFRHWTHSEGRRNKHVHGYVVTDPQHNLLRTINVGTQHWRSARVIKAVLPYVAEAASAAA